MAKSKVSAKTTRGPDIDMFISWSGKRSHAVALALRTHLKLFFSTLEPFVSSEDIRKGQRWPIELGSKLDDCKFGIVILNNENKNEPWILFEAGALSKHVKDSSLYTLLTDGITPADLSGSPLSHFQATTTAKDDVFKMVQAINHSVGSPHTKENLDLLFNNLWQSLCATFVPPKVKFSLEKPAPTIIDIHHMLGQLMGTVDVIAKKIDGNSPSSSVTTTMNDLVTKNTEEALDEELVKILWPTIKESLRNGDTKQKNLYAVLSQAPNLEYSQGVLRLKFTENATHLHVLRMPGMIDQVFDCFSENGADFVDRIYVYGAKGPPLYLKKKEKQP